MVTCHVEHGEHRTLLGKVGKGIVVAASVYHPLKLKQKGDSQAQRAAVQHSLEFDRVKNEKWPAVHFT